MPGAPLEHAAEARVALHAIVSEPDHGVAALSDGRLTAHLLQDLLPDAPREAGILIAAAERGLAGTLRQYVAQGLDGDTAIRLAAAGFGRTTAFTPEVCEWAARELALALDLITPGGAGPPGSAMPATVSGSPALGPPPPEQPGYQQGSGQQPPYGQVPLTGAGWPGIPTAGAGLGAAYQPSAAPTTAPGAWPGPGYQYQAPTGYPPGSGPAPAETATAMPPGWPGRPAPAGRRYAKPVLIVTGVLAAAVVAAVVAVVANSGKPPAPTPVVSIGANSSKAQVGGDVYVYYQDGKYADATISGNISRAVRGEVARLTAQRFPFTSAPAVVGSSRITGKSQRVSFAVAPTLATRYQIEVFGSPSATTPLARSAVQPVYTAAAFSGKITQRRTCSNRCSVSIRLRFIAPPAALQTEETKHVYFYFAVNRSSSSPVAIPKTLFLQTSYTLSAPKILSSNEYQQTLSFWYASHNEYTRWAWFACTRDTESADGIGLPGYHGCGNRAFPASAASRTYIG